MTIVTQSSFMPAVLLLQRPAWWGSSECGFWMCPFCIERYQNAYGFPMSLRFCMGVGNTKIGYCSCGYWVRFADTWGQVRHQVAGRVLEFGRGVVV